jgi:hypothetical protein
VDENMGLAAQAVGQQPVQKGMPTLGQVVAMLKQGADPDELVDMGVPVELVQAAMEQILGEKEVPAEQAGLAGMQSELRPGIGV